MIAYLFDVLKVCQTPYEFFLLGEKPCKTHFTPAQRAERRRQAIATAPEITLEHINNFRKFLKRYYSVNTVIPRLSEFKNAVKKTAKKFDLDIDLDVLEKREKGISKEASESIYLTTEELTMIENYKYQSYKTKQREMREYARCVFLLEAYTGLRVGDVQTLTLENIHNGQVVFTCEKTKTSCRIPLHPSVPKLIRGMNQSPYSANPNAISINKVIKDICCDLKMFEYIRLYRRGERMMGEKYRFVETHTARRSFATNLYLKGYTIIEISKMMGHRSIDMTLGYILAPVGVEVSSKRDFFLKPEGKKKVDESLSNFIQAYTILEDKIVDFKSFMQFCEKNGASIDEQKEILRRYTKYRYRGEEEVGSDSTPQK